VISLILLFIFLVALSFPEEEEFYCVQVASSREGKSLRSYLEKVGNLPDARVEKIGNFYTLRVGFFRKKREAEEVLKKVKEYFPDAFVRGCYKKPERIVYRQQKKAEEENRDDLIELILTALLGAKKLEEAEKILAYLTRKNPKRADLWEMYGKILLWRGKNSQALEAYLKAYTLKPSRSLAKVIFELSLSLKRFDISRKFIEKAEAPYEVKVYVYEQLGDVEALKSLLSRKKEKRSMLTLIRLLFLTGEGEEALKLAEEYQKLHGVDEEFLFLKYEILYSRKRFSEASDFLKAQFPLFHENRRFLSTLSDLAWMLGDYETSVRASYKLIKLGKGRLVDYDRVSLFFFERNPEEALGIASEGWRKFHSLLLLKRALLYAYRLKDYKRVVELFLSAERVKESILKEPSYLYIVADSLRKIGKTQEALDLLLTAFRKYRNPRTLTFLVTFAGSGGDRKFIKKLVRLREIYSKEYALALAWAYFYLGNGKRAYYFYKLSDKKEPLLHADILSLVGKESEAHRIKRRVFEELLRKLKENPSLLKDSDFLVRFLWVSMSFLSPPAYEKILFKVKEFLSEEEWYELYLSYLLFNEKKDKALWLINLKKLFLSPWQELKLGLENAEKLSELLKKDTLSPKDRVLALISTGNFGEAISLIFKLLDKNPYESSLTLTLAEIVEENSPFNKFNISLMTRKDFQELRLGAKFRRVKGSYRLLGEAEKSETLSINRSIISRAPELLSLYLGVEKIGKNRGLGLYAGFYKRLKHKLSLKGFFRQGMGSRFSFSIDWGYNTESTETLYTYLGLLKRFVRLSSSYSVTPKEYIFLSLERSYFFVPSGKYAGSGTNWYGEFVKKLKLSYPDYSLRFFFQRGVYGERKEKRELKVLSPFTDFLILPEDFTSFGAGIFFGDSYRKSLKHSGRPFGGLSGGYSTGIGGMFFNLYGGFSFLLNGGNGITFMGSLSRNSGGVKESILNLEIIYQKWY